MRPVTIILKKTQVPRSSRLCDLLFPRVNHLYTLQPSCSMPHVTAVQLWIASLHVTPQAPSLHATGQDKARLAWPPGTPPAYQVGFSPSCCGNPVHMPVSSAVCQLDIANSCDATHMLLLSMGLCMGRGASSPTTSGPFVARQQMGPSLAPFVGYGCGYGWWRPRTNAATPLAAMACLKHAVALLQELGEACMSTDPKKRPTFPQILEVSGWPQRHDVLC
jgi:hypothetical protein